MKLFEETKLTIFWRKCVSGKMGRTIHIQFLAKQNAIFPVGKQTCYEVVDRMSW